MVSQVFILLKVNLKTNYKPGQRSQKGKVRQKDERKCKVLNKDKRNSSEL